MKKTVIALMLLGSVVYAPQAKAFDCPLGQGVAIDMNVTTGGTSYSCIQLHHFDLPLTPGPVINTITGQTPGTTIPFAPAPRVDTATVVAPVISVPVVDTRTTTTATIISPPTPTPAPTPIFNSAVASANQTQFMAFFNQLVAIINSLMKKLGLL
jgi:hypothetical protein